MAQTQTPSTRYSCDGDYIDHTPGSAVYGGDVVLLGNIPLIATDDIAASEKGALATKGVFKVPKTTAAWTVGLPVFWDPAGDPDGGTTGTGAWTQIPNAYFGGYAVLAAASGDDYGYIELQGRPKFMPIIPTATVAATGTVQADAALIATGFTLVTGADDAKGVKLPPAVAGLQCIIKVADGADLKIWPSTGDAINAIAANSAMTVVDDVCLLLTAYDGTTWYTTPLLPS